MKYLLILYLVLISLPSFGDDSVLFAEDFEKLEAGETPSEFLILEGDFIVKEMDGNKVLLLPGTPLSDYGALFGPSQAEGLQITARIHSDRMKRQFPRFGVGLGGVNGYKLFVTPSKRVLEINKNKQTAAGTPFKWQAGEWTTFRFQIRKVNGEWVIEGKAWQGEKEPEEWMVAHTITEQPITSKPSIWGTPYSSKDILFDDIKIVTATQ